jgi:hypothetical protein
MTTLEIILLIIIIVFSIYLLLGLFFTFQMRSFFIQLSKRKDAIDVLTAQKYDLLRMIGKLFVRHQIDVPQEFILSKRPRFEDTLQNIKDTELSCSLRIDTISKEAKEETKTHLVEIETLKGENIDLMIKYHNKIKRNLFSTLPNECHIIDYACPE